MELEVTVGWIKWSSESIPVISTVWYLRDVQCIAFQIKLVIDQEFLYGSVILSEDREY